MRTTNLLLVIVILFLSSHFNLVIAQARNCEVKATIEIESGAIQSEGKAVVKILDGTAPFKYVFYEEFTGKLLQKDFIKNSVDNLKKGSYYCIVIDNRRCTKKIQFQIQ